jgi:hypothetical protein
MAALLREFVVPLDLEEEMPVRNAEAALPLFVDQGVVEAAGDTITVLRACDGIYAQPVVMVPGSSRCSGESYRRTTSYPGATQPGAAGSAADH